MGTISNLATTGVYTYKEGTLTVSFNFNVSNETKITQISNGRIYEGEELLCTFNGDTEGRITAWGIVKGRSIECATAWDAAISQFESKFNE